MMDRLEAIRDLLKRNVGNSCQPTQSPQTPAHHSESNEQSSSAPAIPNPTANPTSTPSGNNISTPSKPFPIELDQALLAVESIALQDSTIPLGELRGECHLFFKDLFTVHEVDEDDGIWPELDSHLNSLLGADVLPQKLRRGAWGVDGLMRGWLMQSRAKHGDAWNGLCDFGVGVKLKNIHALLKESLITPPQLAIPENPPSQPTENLPSQPTEDQPKSSTTIQASTPHLDHPNTLQNPSSAPPPLPRFNSPKSPCFEPPLLSPNLQPAPPQGLICPGRANLGQPHKIFLPHWN